MMRSDDPSWKILGNSVQIGKSSQVLIMGANLRATLEQVDAYPGISPWIGDKGVWVEILNGIVGDAIGGQRRRLLAHLGISNTAVTLVGSARIGFSLDPSQFGKPFSRSSDLDFAIVDSALFDQAWLELIGLGPRFARLNNDEQEAVIQHRQNNVYWGYIEPDMLPTCISCYKAWFPLFAGLVKYTVMIAGRGASGRIYRTWDHLRHHQLYSLTEIRKILK
jgi:hypothetical protein